MDTVFQKSYPSHNVPNNHTLLNTHQIVPHKLVYSHIIYMAFYNESQIELDLKLFCDFCDNLFLIISTIAVKDIFITCTLSGIV